MLIPLRCIEIKKTHEGKASESGWLVIDIKGMDLDGVTKLHIDLDDVDALGQKRDAAKTQLATLFGGDDEDDPVDPPSEWSFSED